MFRFKLITREQNGVETGHLDEQNVENVVSNKRFFNAVMVKTGSCSLTNKNDQLQPKIIAFGQTLRISHTPTLQLSVSGSLDKR